jgi:hypothetical protein
MRTKSKWLTILLIMTLAMSLIIPGLAMASKDEDENEDGHGKLKDVGKHWASNNVENLKLQGVINGYPDGTFRPEAAVNTTEAVVMAVKLLGLDDLAKSKANATLAFTGSGLCGCSCGKRSRGRQRAV